MVNYNIKINDKREKKTFKLQFNKLYNEDQVKIIARTPLFITGKWDIN